MKEENSEIKRLKKLYYRAHSARAKMYPTRANHEEFYFSDVEGTLSQFTEKQKSFIDQTYSIPISTKISYPIIEQMISFLTGTKPSPRLLAASETVEEWVETYSNAFQGVWYESKANKVLYEQIRDAFVAGSGFNRVRTGNFYNESTFNVVLEYVDWRKVYIDPYCKKSDLSDAEFIIIGDVMMKRKAEREYDIDLRFSDNINNSVMIAPSEEMPEWFIAYDISIEEKEDWVWIREYFEKEERNVYVSENGEVSVKKPKPINAPNPERIKLEQQLAVMTEQAGKAEQQQSQIQQRREQAAMSPETEGGELEANSAMEEASSMNGEQVQGLNTQMQQIQQQIAQMPETVPAFLIKVEVNKEEIETLAYNVTRIKRKMIKRSLVVGDHLVEVEYLPGETYPIGHLTFQWGKSPNKTYGVMHYIIDLVKAMNKFWSSMLYDMQMNNHRRVLYAKGTIEKISDIERSWSIPGGWVEYIPDPTLPNGGLPQVIEPFPISQATVYVLDSLLKLIEYVTGIFGVMQGNAQEAPSTFGGTQSLQTFGTQRMKLYSRALSEMLENISGSIVYYIQKYAPRDKVLKFFDENGDMKEVQIMADTEDVVFKTRVDITNSLPTVRQMTAELIGIIAGQTKNPQVADYLTQYMLKTLDLPEGDQIAEQIDVIKQMEQQLAQMQEQLDTESKKNKALENNLYQKSLSSKVDLAAEKANSDIQLEKERQMPTEEQEDVEVSPIELPL